MTPKDTTIGQYAPGDTVDVEYIREGKHELTNVALKSPPEKH